MELDTQEIKQKMAAFLKVPVERIDDNLPLQGIVPDSFMMVELLIELQEEYSVRLDQSDLEGIEKVAELTAMIKERVESATVLAE